MYKKKGKWNKPGRPGQMQDGMAFCPIFNRWISDIRCLEIRLSRRQYDDIKESEELEMEQHSQTIQEATLNSGRVFPEQIREVVVICQFCEEQCLGKMDGPCHIPSYNQLTKHLGKASEKSSDNGEL